MLKGKYIVIGIPLLMVVGFMLASIYSEGMGVGFWFGIGLMEAGLLGLAWLGYKSTMEDCNESR